MVDPHTSGDSTTSAVHQPLTVDSARRLTDGSVVVTGWAVEPGERGRMYISVGAGDSVHTVEAPCVRTERADLRDSINPDHSYYGFVACVPAPSGDTAQLRFTLPSGSKIDHTATITGSTKPVGSCLDDTRMPSDQLAEIIAAHILPILTHDIATAPAPSVRVGYQAADLPQRPRTNIVVPVFDNYRYLPNLLLLAANHRWTDTVFTLVSDDPRIDRQFDRWVADWNGVYGAPVRVVRHNINAGFAAACNSGVAATDSELVFLLNSDVLPPADGGADPVAALARHLDDPAVAAVAPALLYPDTSVQHAGMILEASDRYPKFTLPAHPLKGMPPTWLPKAPFGMPLLSGAAILLRRADYLAVGGMPTRYGRGDFEDVEFSLALGARGALVVDPGEHWVHMEGASYARGDSAIGILLTLAKSTLLPESAHLASGAHALEGPVS